MMSKSYVRGDYRRPVLLDNGKYEWRNYQELCHDLGMDPGCEFVRLTNKGTIDFTMARNKYELRHLINAACKMHYQVSRNLLRFMDDNFLW